MTLLGRWYTGCPAKIRNPHINVLYISGAPARFQARVRKHFGENSAQSAEKIFDLPTLVFSLPTLDLTTRVGKDPPAIFEVVIIASPLALRTIHFAYQFVYTIISNYTTLNVQ